MAKNNKYNLENRRYVLGTAVVLVVLVFVVRLFFLQVVENNYKAWADSNAFLKKTLYPSRGMMYDRNGKLLVYNQPAYDVMLIMREIQPFDTLDFCRTLNITPAYFVKRIAAIKDRRLNPGYSSYVPQVFLNQLSTREYGILQEKLYKFPGFYIQNRTIREYAYPYAAHVLGNLGEVNRKDIESDAYYTSGDYSGRAGIEKSYETILRGNKGVEILLRDAHGRIKGKYEDGKHDIIPQSGKNLTLSLDIELQAYGEKLMQNKLGSIVMIEPETGEILCMVSGPSYDPGMLAGRERGKNHVTLSKDPLKPLFDRSIMSYYPPGSTFKPTQGLIFLQEKIIAPSTPYTCSHGYPLLGGKPACHWHYSPLNLISALATSCNSYFCWGLHDMLGNRRKYSNVQEAFEIWKNYVVSMGYGYKLGVDLPNEKRGYIPNSTVYDKAYNKRWNSSTVISIAIGQGEITVTPLQICNMGAQIFNKGYFITPHVVKEIDGMPLDTLYTQRRYTKIDPIHYDAIWEGMSAAVTGGTCTKANLPDIKVYGKTGTAENRHGEDHSAFLGFASYNGRNVAIAVYVENAGFGAAYAVPMGRLMIEKGLRGYILEESKYYESQILNAIILPHYRNTFTLPKREVNDSTNE